MFWLCMAEMVCSAYKGRFMVHLARKRTQLGLISTHSLFSPEGYLTFPLHSVTHSVSLEDPVTFVIKIFYLDDLFY